MVVFRIDNSYLQDIHDLFCGRSHAPLTTTHLEADSGTLCIVEDATRIIDISIVVLGNENTEVVSSRIIEE